MGRSATNRPSAVIATACIAALIAAATGCAPNDGALEPIVLGAVADGPVGFADMAIVLAASVDDDGRIDPTALVTQVPRLQRQLAQLAQPWPDEATQPGSDVRLAWLYNARAAWSLHLVAGGHTLTGPGADRYALAATIAQSRLLDTPVPLDGGVSSLRLIDQALARWDDFRIACSAPCATDLAGRLPDEPFDAATVRERVGERFNAYVCDGPRVVIDHETRRIRIPPALAAAHPAIIARHNSRYGTDGAILATALRPYLDRRGRRLMIAAMGYEPVVRAEPPGIVVVVEGRLTRGLRR